MLFALGRIHSYDHDQQALTAEVTPAETNLRSACPTCNKMCLPTYVASARDDVAVMVARSQPYRSRHLASSRAISSIW